MTRAELAIVVPIADLINSNGREHYQVKAKKRATLRNLAGQAARGLPCVEAPCRGVVTFVWPDRVRRDPDNYELKPIWDALVDCGVLTDDNGEILRATIRFAAPWRHDLGRGLVALGIKVEGLGDVT